MKLEKGFVYHVESIYPYHILEVKKKNRNKNIFYSYILARDYQYTMLINHWGSYEPKVKIFKKLKRNQRKNYPEEFI